MSLFTVSLKGDKMLNVHSTAGEQSPGKLLCDVLLFHLRYVETEAEWLFAPIFYYT